MPDNISSKVLDEVGKVSSEALKGVTDPFIRIAFALMVILNLIGFGTAIGMLVLAKDKATYAFIACMVMILVDFIIVVLLIMKRTSKIADMNAQTTALNSIYNANVQLG